MSEPEAPTIEFPCEYPVKVVCRKNDGFLPTVLEVFERHAPGFDRTGVAARDSAKGTFCSLTITIVATGRDQLDALHQDLMASGAVQMVI